MANKDSQILQAEAEDAIESNCVADTLSAQLESCAPFSVPNTEPSSNCMNQPDISHTDALLDPLNSIVLSESPELRYSNGKGSSRFDDAHEKNIPEIICSSTRRSTRKSTSNQKVDNKLAVRKCRKTSGKGMLDLLLVNVGRRRRSDLAKRARASAWGLGGNINEIFEQTAKTNLNENEHIESRKKRTGRKVGMRKGKRNTNVVTQSIQSSKGESQALNRGLLLKFKLGKKVIQNCEFNTIPDMDKDLESYREVKIEPSKLPSHKKDGYKEQLPCVSMSQSISKDPDKGMVISKASAIDVLFADKDMSNDLAGKAGNIIHDIIGAVETIENRCLDPGTSPDSEVINVIPDTQISGIAMEGLHDIQISLKDCDGVQSGDCGIQSGLPSPEIINDVPLCYKDEHDGKIIDGSCSSGASISTTTGVASRNASSSKGFPTEPMTSLEDAEVGVSREMLTTEIGRRIDLNAVGLESVESWVSVEASNGQKLPESLRSSGMSKSRSQVPDSVNKKHIICQLKGSEPKSTGKDEIEEKNGNDQAVCETESNPEGGNYETGDIGELKKDCRSTTETLSSSAVAPSEGENQKGSSRNAWVCCDDCHKWRRIPAILADSIESTECRWTCKDNMDKAFADCSISQEKSNADINEELEISDASCEEDGCTARLNSNQLGQKQPIDPPQSSWKLIKTNLFLHRNRKNQTIDEIMVCHCKPPLDGRRGCRDACLNRMLNIECVKGTCPCGELCSNQQFQKRKYANLKCYRCGKKGYGLQLQEDIPKGRFLIEYVGEVLDMHAYEARQREYASKGHKHFYFMTLNGSEVIDACAKGNLGRFINHSCEPNCRTEKWMVNGEVCIGLFAIRDIKKGEELTFDYNYVRVFGAAAKKCVCGSSRCRGFIGGDPLNAETVVLGDSDEEYPIPTENSRNKLDNVSSRISSFDDAGRQTTENTCKDNRGEIDNCATASGHLEGMEDERSPDSLLVVDDENDNLTTSVECIEKEVSFERPSSTASELENKIDDSEGLLPFSVQSLDASLPPNDAKSEITSQDPVDRTLADKDMKECLSTGKITKASLNSLANLLPDTGDTKRKPKSHTDETKCTILKPHRRPKPSGLLSVVKRGKPKRNVINNSKLPEKDNRSPVVPQKAKRLVENAINDRFEAVQEALNTLLDADGGISRRKKDASKGYLKLLCLTAASGDSGNGEVIQSNRDLSMILDALLKTKSRTVLHDIINKNGLQLLHNIMKRNRKEFQKIPILRKLLKVLEYLAEMKILTLENITKPSCHGAESLKESMLSLTEHTDKKVHQIARDFRDRWIPRNVRRINWVERDAERMEHQTSSNSRSFTPPRNHSSDPDRRPSEVADSRIKLSHSRPTTPVDARTVDGSSTSHVSSCLTDGTRSRKRKSRWDQPGDVKFDNGFPSDQEYRSKSIGSAELNESRREGQQNSDEDEDAPPGFSSLMNGNPSSTCSKPPHSKAVMAYPQEKYNSRLPTSFGVPSSVIKRVGATEGAAAKSWVVAPAVTFHPYPPLPSYPRHDNPMNPHARKEHFWRNHTDPTQNTPSTTCPADMPVPGPYNQQHFQRFRNSSNTLGRRYFKQQKWSNSRPGLPWNPNKNGPGGLISTNRSNAGMEYGGNEANNGPYNSSNGFYQQPPPSQH